MNFVINVFPIINFGIRLLIALLSIFMNGLTILALRKRYELRKMLGTTSFLLVGCLSLTHLLYGLFGIPLSAVDRLLEANWPPSNGNFSIPATCIITAMPGIVLYNIALWFLLSIALVRFGLVFWPHAAKRVMGTRAAMVVACVVPVLLGLFPTVYGMATRAVRFGKIQNHCGPMPYDDTTPEGNLRMQIYQLIALAWSLILPVPTSFALYLAMGIKLFIQERAKDRRAGVAPGGGRIVAPVAVNSALTQTSKLESSAIAAVVPTTDESLELKPLRRKNSAVPLNDKHVVNNKIQTVPTKAPTKAPKKYHVVQMLAYAYVVNILCICPVYILWMSGFYYSVEKNTAGEMFAESVDWLYMFAAPMDSIMYALVSTDFRRVYKRILKCN